jgi:hypothetical protein
LPRSGARLWQRAVRALRGESTPAARRVPTFVELMRDIEAEAYAEGPESIEELQRLKEQYAIMGQELLRRRRNGQ